MAPLVSQRKAFDKFIVSPATQPNATLRTKEEKSRGFMSSADPSGDTINNDGDLDAGQQCDGKKKIQAQKNYIMQNEKSSDYTPEGQENEVVQADALCGPEKHAQKDTQAKIEKKMPKGESRYFREDVVWDAFTGNHVDEQGLMPN